MSTNKPSHPFAALNTSSIFNQNHKAEKEPIDENKPWVEKYRPKDIKDISSQEDVVKVLTKALTSDNLPHLLFYGPPGTGKTSTILALAQQLYGPTLIKSRVLELNASDERGIQIVREKIKNFSRRTVTKVVSDYPCPSYKIIILDEADLMTKDAQSALRRIMETYSKTTRFCIICNYVSRIIEPITSRCAKFRFKPLPTEDLEKRINMVCESENVQLGKGSIEALIKVSNGDLRKAITFLQSASNLYINEPIPPTTFYEIGGIIPETIIKQLSDAWESKDQNKVLETVQEIVNSGFSGEQLVIQITEEITKSSRLSDIQKANISQVLGTVDNRLIHGADEHLQILYLMTELTNIVAH
ncbi:P-loop containing nucleoside triphosphate hydrolase protein [Phycomyces nitens]|nr:P-loop containing nucleoside triphosphate hydrolase protein [Phycomyces nitens]